MSATGTVNVGVSSGTINIGTSAVGGTVNVGHNSGVGATGTINLGVSSSNVNINTTQIGTTTIGNGGTGSTIALNSTTSVATLNIANPAGALSIANNITTGNVNFATTNAHTGAIYIGTSNTRAGNAEFGSQGTGNVIVGSGNAPLFLRGSTIAFTGTASIGSLDASVASSGLSLGNNITTGNLNLLTSSSFSGNVYIGTNNTARTGTADIFTAGTGTVTIGSLNAPLALRGSTTTFSSPLTLGSLPSNAGQLGYTYTIGITQAVATSGLAYASITIGTAGVYLFTFGVSQTVTTLGSINYLTISGSGAVSSNFGAATVTSGPTGQLSFQGSSIFECTASTYNLVANTNSTNNATPSGFFRATRIA